MSEDKIACRTPTTGRDGVTNLLSWKFEAVRTAILDAVGGAGPEGLAFADLPGAVAARLAPEALARLGSVGWHTTTVKLELEVRGEIRRTGASPQRLVLA